MKLSAGILLLAWLATAAAHAQISQFEHIILVIQENRTPDNLFQGLCVPPYGKSGSCNVPPGPGQYNIQTKNWLDKSAAGGIIQPQLVELGPPLGTVGNYDLGHGHPDWVSMCDVAANVCKMDGAAGVTCGPHDCGPKKKESCCLANPQFRYVDNSQSILNPYLDLATQYGWANYMFQTNQGPSFPAHQFLFGGTSAPTALQDSQAIFASENMHSTGIGGTQAHAGCTAPNGEKGTHPITVALIQPPDNETQFVYPCFEHETMGDFLTPVPMGKPRPPQLSWRYYAPNATSIWTAPNAIQHICVSNGPGGKCTGPVWTANVDQTFNPSDVLQDISNCVLRSVSWVIPTGWNSDHAHGNDGGGPSWVASIVNAVGGNTTCDKGGYWKNTAIVITWDDWGGWYDHEPPTILKGIQGDYQYGFRVPLIVVSAYTPKGYIDNDRHDFGSILRFVENNFGIQEGALHFADERASTNLSTFFNLKMAPRPFQEIKAPKNAQFFINDKRPHTDPDTD